MPSRSPDPSDSRMGNSAASVLPDPVGATMRTCEPARISDSARACISFIFEISARWSNWVSSVLRDLLRTFGCNTAGDRTRMIKTVRRVGRTYGSTVARSGGKVQNDAYEPGTKDYNDYPGTPRLSAKLRLDESACLLIGAVRLPDCNRILLPVSPDETQVYPRLTSIEAPLFHDPEILRANLTVLAHSKGLQLLEPGFLCGCGWKP